MSVTSAGGDSYTASVTLQSTDTDGLIRYTINAQDNVGNPTSFGPEDSGVTLDRSSPSITNDTVSAPADSWVKAGETFEIDFDVADNSGGSGVNGTPSVTITSGGANVSGVSVASAGGDSYTASVTLQDTDTDGAIAYTIDAEDTAGNTTTLGPVGSGVSLDTVVPAVSTVTLTNNGSSADVAEAGDTITIVFTEANSIDPTTVDSGLSAGGDITGTLADLIGKVGSFATPSATSQLPVTDADSTLELSADTRTVTITVGTVTDAGTAPADNFTAASAITDLADNAVDQTPVGSSGSL